MISNIFKNFFIQKSTFLLHFSKLYHTDMNNSIHALSSSFLLTYNAHFRKIHSLRYFPHRRYTVGILSAHEIRKTDA